MLVVPIHKRSDVVRTMSNELAAAFLGDFRYGWFIYGDRSTFTIEQYAIVRNLFARHGIRASTHLRMFIAALTKNESQAILYCHALSHAQSEFDRSLKIADLLHMFPVGFPTDAALGRAWLEQKVIVDQRPINALDCDDQWPTHPKEQC